MQQRRRAEEARGGGAGGEGRPERGRRRRKHVVCAELSPVVVLAGTGGRRREAGSVRRQWAREALDAGDGEAAGSSAEGAVGFMVSRRGCRGEELEFDGLAR